MKFVSIRTRYGGTRAVLWARNSDEATGALCKQGMMKQSERDKQIDAHSTDSPLLLLSFFLFLL